MTRWPRVIAHVDMDAFFASLEIRDQPSLRGRPVAVGGGADRRGVVAAASYEARKYGVRSALPMKTALQLCPQLVVIPPHFEKYADASKRLHEIFEAYSPRIEPLSLDEAFLDLTGAERLLGSPREIGEGIRSRIQASLHITGSVGISTSKFVAKLASDHRKPDGLTIVPPEEVASFVRSLPLERLWGVGPATLKSLHRAGIRSMEALADADSRVLQAQIGNQAEHLIRLACGIDNRPVQADLPAKSISHEETFARDIADEGLLLGVLLELSERVARRARRHGVAGRTVGVKLRTPNFETSIRHRTLSEATADAAHIHAVARELFLEWWKDRRPVRLLGVGLQNLVEGEQLSLFAGKGESTPEDSAGRVALQGAEDEIIKRFGGKALSRARALLSHEVDSTGSLPGRPLPPT